uniref:BLOC-1-related complex subunit 6 C-terminal helix domain-containing protein n=1 Tax=Panagrolaimus sp. JU765 TaxID=591449 RepID=A0AC34QSZ0_9BILA
MSSRIPAGSDGIINSEDNVASSSNTSMTSTPEHRPARVGARRSDKNAPRVRRPSDDLIPDPLVLHDLEVQARAISSNLDMCLRDLRGSLRGMSDLTLEHMQTYSSAINSTCDNVDAAIKSMYKLVAKAEELTESVDEAKKVVAQIKDMKRLVDLLEARLIADNITTTQ